MASLGDWESSDHTGALKTDLKDLNTPEILSSYLKIS